MKTVVTLSLAVEQHYNIPLHCNVLRAQQETGLVGTEVSVIIKHRVFSLTDQSQAVRD